MDAVFNLGNVNDIYNRGWAIREAFLKPGPHNAFPGMATDPVGAGILDYLGRLPGDHLEIGTGLNAASAYVVAQAKTEGHVYTIDNAENKVRAIKALIEGRKTRDRITFACTTSAELPWPGPFTSAYIDGEHTYEGVMRDWLVVSRLAEYVVFDDVLPLYEGIMRAYAEARLTPGWQEVFFLGRVGVLWKSQ